jgi:hypothetical protein
MNENTEFEATQDSSINVKDMYAQALQESANSEETTTPSSEPSAPSGLSQLISKSNGVPEEEATEPETIPVTREESPLDRAIKSKSNGAGGFKVAEEKEEGPLRPIYDSDSRRKDMEKTVQELDDLALKAKAIVAYKKPENEMQRAQMMTDISGVVLDPETGAATYVPPSEFIIARTPEVNAEIERIKARENTSEESDNTDGEEKPTTKENASYSDVEEYIKEAKKDELVHVIIDKTGLGANITFDDDEEKVIQSTNMIHLVEVEDRDLRTVSYHKPEDGSSFLNLLDTYQLSTSKAPMTFPGSGFKADMVGMSYGEFVDVTLDTSENSNDYLSFERMNQRLSTVYNLMRNISTGPFKDYTDFLQKFAFVDVQLAIYGLTIATQPEMDTLAVRCTKDGCGKGFNYKYSPRSIIDFSSASTAYLDMIKEINECPPDKRLELAANSGVQKIRRFQMPSCKYLVDFGLASCYDYLYKLVKYIEVVSEKADNMEDNDPEAMNLAKKASLIPMLYGVRAVVVPTRNGANPTIFTEPDDILEALMSMPLSDMRIANAIYEKYIGQYHVDYCLKDVECPHCKHKTAKVYLTPDDLVFQILQHQGNTEITFDNFPEF